MYMLLNCDLNLLLEILLQDSINIGTRGQSWWSWNGKCDDMIMMDWACHDDAKGINIHNQGDI